jgi:hypothetical protein
MVFSLPPPAPLPIALCPLATIKKVSGGRDGRQLTDGPIGGAALALEMHARSVGRWSNNVHAGLQTVTILDHTIAFG